MFSPVFGAWPSAGTRPHFSGSLRPREPQPDAAALERMADAFLRAADDRQAAVEEIYETPPAGVSREDHLFDLASEWEGRQQLENRLYSLDPSMDGLLARYQAVHDQTERARDYPESAQAAWRHAIGNVQRELADLTGTLFTEWCLQPEPADDMPAMERSDGSLNPDFLQPGNYQAEVALPPAIRMDYIHARRFVKAVLDNQAIIPHAAEVLRDLFGRLQRADRDYAPEIAYEFLLEEARQDRLPRALKIALVNAAALNFRDGEMIRQSFSEFQNVNFDNLDWKNNPVGAGVNYLKARSQLDHVLQMLDGIADAPGLTREFAKMRTVFAEAGGKIDSYWSRLCDDRMTGEDAGRLWQSMHRLPDTPGVEMMLNDLIRQASPFRIGGLD